MRLPLCGMATLKTPFHEHAAALDLAVQFRAVGPVSDERFRPLPGPRLGPIGGLGPLGFSLLSLHLQTKCLLVSLGLQPPPPLALNIAQKGPSPPHSCLSSAPK